ncbi:MAG: UvrD-helicase domain-containing protein [Parvibaculum sp.]
MSELSERLAVYGGAGYIMAPADHGKTYLIAEVASHHEKRRLILTHTYSGVNALRRKLRELGVADSRFHVDTIASWSLRLALAYTQTSGWAVERPSGDEWNALYNATSALLDCEFMRRILRTSYIGVCIDEYQDCSVSQHNIVLKLARDLPCCVFGDPLQGIFEFDGQDPIDWRRDVEGNFELLEELEEPFRWKLAGAQPLGDWLSGVRENLENGRAVDLRLGRPANVTLRLAQDENELIQVQRNICRYFDCGPQETVIAIHKGSQEYKARCHTLARNLGGRYSSIEEIEGRELFLFLRRLEGAITDADRLRHLISFAAKCMTAVEASLAAGTRRGERVVIRANTRNPEVAQKGNDFLDIPDSRQMLSFLMALENVAAVNVVREDLFNRLLGVLRKHILYPAIGLAEAAEKYHSEFRYKGRPVRRRRIIGTTLLVKGLEYDHAIVLDASSLSRKELYVALTRGAQTLTIVSTRPVLNPDL